MDSFDGIGSGQREYRLKGSQKFSYLALASIFIFGAGFFFKLAINPIGRDFVLIVGGIFLIPGLILLSLAFRSRLILDGDRIELRSAIRTFSANRSDIEGLRKVENQYGSWTRICLKEDRGAFNVSNAFTGADYLQEWLKGLPDLDQRDADRITQQINEQEHVRANGNGHSNEFRNAKAFAIGLSTASGIVSVPVMFLSYRPLYTTSLILLIVLPLFGILLLHRYPLLFTIFKGKVDPRADLGFVVIWPGLGMLFSVQTGNDPTHLVDMFGLIYWVLLALIFYMALLAPIAWKSSARWGVLFFLLICGGMYSIGVVNAANTLPDRSTAYLYRTEVLGKYVHHSSKSTSYNLRLAAWGGMAYSDDVSVPTDIYQQVNTGDLVCIGLHPGSLHAPWYTLSVCRE